MSLQSLFNRLYWMIVLLLIVLCFVVFDPDNTTPLLKGVAATNLQQLLVLLGLGGLPGVLVWSSRQVKKFKSLTSMDERVARYRKVLYVRLAVFAGIGLYALLVQYLSHMKGALMFMMLVFVLFVFVWPTKGRFETELGKESVPNHEEEEAYMEAEEMEEEDPTEKVAETGEEKE